MKTANKQQAKTSLVRVNSKGAVARLLLACLFALSLTQQGVAAIVNSAVAIGDYQSSPVTSNASLVSIPVTGSVPDIELQKSSVFNDENGDGGAQVGETISYSFVVRNTGNVTLTNITLTDPTVTVTGGPIASLAPGASDNATFSASHTITATNLSAGQVSNTATVSGLTPSSATVTDDSDSLNPGDDTGADNDPTVTPLPNVVIDAVNNDFTSSPINSITGGNTPTIYANDTLNGAPFAPALVVGSITNNGGLTGVTLAANGTLNVPAGTPAGTYTVSYQICEAANPPNCDIAQVTGIVVTTPTISAVDDDFSPSPISGVAGGTTASVFTNDTLNGNPFLAAAVNAVITANGGLTGVSINADGTLTVPGGLAAGSYVVTYRICEVAQPTNCDTANATVVVSSATIIANDDDFTSSPVNGLTGGLTPTVYSNDTLNGVAFAPAAVTPSITNAGGLTGVSINPNGTLSVPAGTAAGSYPVTYQICEVLNPTNCDTAIATVVVQPPAIVAADDDFSASPVNGAAGGYTPTVFTNDTLNGVSFAPAAVTPSISNTGGLTGVTINPDGTLSVPAGTPAGSYAVTYQICEVLNPTNCDTAVASVVVAPPAIVASDDDFTASPINGTSGGATPTVFTNDTLNGVGFAPSAVVASITNAGGLAGVTINPDGTLTVPGATAASTYSVTYQICEALNPANCDTAIATVVVTAAAIVANDDDFTASPINGLAGGATPTVFTNDTLNGASFAAAAVTPSITNAGGLTGASINADGTVSVPAGTPAATYSVTYQICEVLNPANCDTAVATIVVNAATIVAVDDDFSTTPVNALSGGNTSTVFVNDTLNGTPFAAAAVTASISANGGLAGVTINPDGTLSVPAGSAPGAYIVTYLICEVANPSNCDSANASVVVIPAAIVANDDNFSATPVNGLTGGATPTVYTNDTLAGAAFAPASVTPAITATGGLTGVVINAADGTLTVPAGTPAGTYNVTYRICEVAVPSNCDTAVATVVVNPPAIVANDDNFAASPVNGMVGGATPTVFTNDTLNGVAFAPAAVAPTITSAGGLTGATIAANGTINVPAGTPAGSYPVTYQICEVANPANCDTAIATVVVNPPAIVANDDNFTASPVNGLVGGATPTVFTNDTLNGAAFAPASVSATITNTGGLTGATIAANGTINVPAGTSAGSYPVTYQICEVLNPANCDTAIATVVVAAPTISAVDDNFTGTPINGGTGGTTATVYSNDTLNGAAFAASAVTPSITSNGGLTGLLINPAGTLTVPAGTAPGAYTVTYQICENTNPTNCDTANVTLVVNPPVIDAVADNFSTSPVNSATGGTTPTVLTNDTLNGTPATSATVTPTITNVGGLTGATMNPNGTITVPAGAAPGTYSVTYQICQIAVPSNCDSAVATVVVTANNIAANDDNYTSTPVNGTAGGVTPSVLGNDTLNGTPVTAASVVPALVNTGGLTGATINTNGSINVPAGTPAGTYLVTYQICEAAQPVNCDTAVASIAVTNAPQNATVAGTVYFDANGNGVFDGDPNAGAGYVVEVRDSAGLVIATATTNASGQYSATVPPGTYSLVFLTPAGSVVGGTAGIVLPSGITLNDQNQPIDPSGIVYNSVTRSPVAGVTVTLASASNVPLPAVCFIDASQQNQVTGANGAYRFDLVPGANPACPVGETEYHILIANPAGYQSGYSTAMPPQSATLDATSCPVDPAIGGACLVSPNANPPGAPAIGVYYTAILLQSNDPHVVHNHLPIDPIIVNQPGFTKKALIVKAKRGEKIPFVIEARLVTINPARIVDIMPAGLDFVPGSATINGTAIAPAVDGNRLVFNGLSPDATGTIKLELLLVANVAVTTGPKINKAQFVDPSNGTILSTAQATVTIVVDHVFDCGDVIGKVFDDKNRDGYQDKGEVGLPGVRLVTVKGVLITTDKDGLFHVPCAELPDPSIGSNFVLKLDTRTLPSGYRVTTENPRIVRLTAGKATKLNFGASVGRVVKFDVTGDAFVANSTKLKPQWVSAVDKLIGILADEKSTLRLTYIAKVDGSKLAADRLAGLEKLVVVKWKQRGTGYVLPIEKRLIARKAEVIAK